MTAVTQQAQARLPLHRLPAPVVASVRAARLSPIEVAARNIAFGAVINRHRRWQALSRADLAAAVGLPADELADIEYGRCPSMTVAFALADALGQELAELVFEAETQASGTAPPTGPPDDYHERSCRPSAAAARVRPFFFAAIIAGLRLSRDWSPDDLATVAGVDPEEIANLDRGQLPNLGCAFALAEALGVRTDQLLHQVRLVAQHELEALA